MRYIILFLAMLCEQMSWAGEILRLVNDEVISDYDVSERLSLRRLFDPQQQDNKAARQKILEDLTDEKIKLQVAKQANINISDEEVNQAIAYLEQQNHMQPNSMKKKLKENGISADVLMTQTRADLSWLRYLQYKQVKAPEISQKQIKELKSTLEKDMRSDRYLLSAIYIPYGKSKKQAEQKAQKAFDEIVAGASFSQTARTYSNGVHAKNGGDLGWTTVEKLDDLVQKVVGVMNVGQLSKPIAGKTGYYIVLLREKVPGMTSAEVTTIALSQILVPKDKIETVIKTASMAQDCVQFDTVAKEFGSDGSGPVGEIVLEKVPPEIARVLESTPMKTASVPIETPNEFIIFMKCQQRKVTILPDEQTLRQRLELEALEKQSAQLLQDLRKQAVIE